MPSDFIKVIEQRIREARPDLDIRDFTPLHDLLIKPHALLQEPERLDIEALAKAQSLASEGISDEDVDRLVANIFLSRINGEFATGVARIYVTTPATLVFDSAVVFVASNGQTYVPSTPISFPESLVRLNVDGSFYYVDVPVIAQNAGVTGRIKAHLLSTLQGSSINFAKVDNPFPFSGGVDRETNAQLIARAADAITVRDLVSGRGIQTRLRQVFSFLERVFVAGYLDPEQQRDVVSGIHVGGKADIRIKVASLLSDEVKITVPANDGRFVLSAEGDGAPGNDVRPAVFLDAVRLLGPGPAFTPIGTPRTRQETTLVETRGLVASGEFREAMSAINVTLNQLFVVAIEVVSPTERYVAIARLDIQGNVQTPFARLTEASATASNPHVAVNSANNRAYVFWAEESRLLFTIIDTVSVGFTKLKGVTALLEGNDEILGRMDSAFAVDGNVHLVFTQRTTNDDATTVDAVWYARLTADGTIPGLVTPRQVVFDLPGDNQDPTLVVHGATTTTLVTVVFASNRGTYSNLYGLQIDNDGELLDLPQALTTGFEFNDLPTLRNVGTSGALSLAFRRNLKGISFLRIQKESLVVSLPRQDVISRGATVKELRMVLNPYGFPYVYWTELIGDFEDVLSAKLDAQGQRIGPVHNLTETPYFSSRPFLLSDSSGALHMTWIDGLHGLDKPFYLKRLPQEWHLTVLDERYRFSTHEELGVYIELPAANGIAVDIRWADLLPQVQEFVSSNEERTIVADLLVRHQVPSTVSCQVRFGPRGGSLTEAAAKAVIETYITDFQGSEISVSALTSLLFERGATSVAPFSLTVQVDRDDGTIDVLESDDRIALPRGVFLTPSGITAKYR